MGIRIAFYSKLSKTSKQKVKEEDSPEFLKKVIGDLTVENQILKKSLPEFPTNLQFDRWVQRLELDKSAKIDLVLSVFEAMERKLPKLLLASVLALARSTV